ncbi:Rieske 2Fe-2S domain-containing protein [Archangium lipolyticum]|uniref:Rieske 2Fe-2S domain-containing protein n=1 Tax=Archangium lipolyticum TaxID=2970465 RepID=UPI00214A6AFE|nr:Rieske 2Fe-2S domain-containing protein [Archangium lipolyticum]
MRDTWYPVLEAKRLGRRPVKVTRLGRELVLWRDARGQPVAQETACPHRGADLSRGRVVGGCLECPYHGMRFSADGACVHVPCEGKARPIRTGLRVKGYAVRESLGLVWLWWGEQREELPPLPWSHEIPGEGAGTCTATLTWNVPFARVMEGNLDLHHFPFAHRRWAPGMGTWLEPYTARLEGDVIHTHCVLRQDDGRPWDGRSGFEAEIRVLFPHLLLARFGRFTQTLAVATPIDEENTWVVFRYRSQLPLVGGLVAWFLVQAEVRLIQPEDHALLRDGRPRHPVREDFHLVRADAGIALWFRMYERRLAAQRGTRMPPP